MTASPNRTATLKMTPLSEPRDRGDEELVLTGNLSMVPPDYASYTADVTYLHDPDKDA